MKAKVYLSSEAAFDALRSSVESYLSISSDYYEELCKRLTLKRIPRGEMLIGEGQVCDYLYFLAGGFCFTYYVRDGKEFVTNLFAEGEFVFISHSFFGRRNSLFNMKTSENCTFLVLGYSDFIELFKEYQEFKELITWLVIQRLILQECIEPVFRCHTAKARILHFYKSHQIQEWMQHIPQYRIASWLNMTPEVFAKIWGRLDE